MHLSVFRAYALDEITFLTSLLHEAQEAVAAQTKAASPLKSGHPPFPTFVPDPSGILEEQPVLVFFDLLPPNGEVEIECVLHRDTQMEVEVTKETLLNLEVLISRKARLSVKA